MGYGTGEAGISSIPKEKYFEELSDPVIEAVVTASCNMFEVSEPTIVLLPEPSSRRWGGQYKHKSQEVLINRRYMGLLIHEVAHHITKELYGKIK